MTAEKKKSRLRLYSAYVFRGDDKDPIIDIAHTWLDDAGVSYAKAAELSGLSASTIHAWIEGDTKRPQYCTIAALAGALGKEMRWVDKKTAGNVVSMPKRRRVA